MTIRSTIPATRARRIAASVTDGFDKLLAADLTPGSGRAIDVHAQLLLTMVAVPRRLETADRSP